MEFRYCTGGKFVAAVEKKQVDRVFEVLLFCDLERASFNRHRVSVSGEKVKLNIVLKSVSCIVYRVSISKKLQAKSR